MRPNLSVEANGRLYLQSASQDLSCSTCTPAILHEKRSAGHNRHQDNGLNSEQLDTAATQSQNTFCCDAASPGTPCTNDVVTQGTFSHT